MEVGRGEEEKGGSRDRWWSGSGLCSDDDGEGYIKGVMVRVIEHGEGWGYMKSVMVRVI